MSIISKLFGLRKSADYATAIAELQGERDTEAARLEDLKAQRNVAPFEGGDLPAIQAAIAATEQQLETLHGLIGEASRRLDAAKAAETEESVIAIIAVARKDRGALRQASKKFDAALGEVERYLAEMQRLSGDVAQANREADGAGVPQLRIRCPALPTTTMPAGELSNSLKNLRYVSLTSIFETMAQEGRLD